MVEEEKVPENKRVPFNFECEERRKNSFYSPAKNQINKSASFKRSNIFDYSENSKKARNLNYDYIKRDSIQ